MRSIIFSLNAASYALHLESRSRSYALLRLYPDFCTELLSELPWLHYYAYHFAVCWNFRGDSLDVSHTPCST